MKFTNKNRNISYVILNTKIYIPVLVKKQLRFHRKIINFFQMKMKSIKSLTLNKIS